MQRYEATATNIVDGDTADFRVRGKFLHLTLEDDIRVRFLGINCPEVHGETKAAGLAAAAYVREQLLGKDVVLEMEKTDDFGRWIGRVWVGGEDFCLQLVSLGYAIPYMVGK